MLHLDGGETVTAKCLLIATGADYNRLGVEGCERFEGAGVYYAATPNEATLCRGCEVVVVGGGNSAGQAAVYLAGQARRVLLVIRGDDLYKNMSSYLVRRIEQNPAIELCSQHDDPPHGRRRAPRLGRTLRREGGEGAEPSRRRRSSASSGRRRGRTGCRRRSRRTRRGS